MLLPLIAVVTGCSTSRNTAASRSYQALVTKYNVYFNGNEAFKSGMAPKHTAEAMRPRKKPRKTIFWRYLTSTRSVMKKCIQ